jgi:hypothetical protein
LGNRGPYRFATSIDLVAGTPRDCSVEGVRDGPEGGAGLGTAAPPRARRPPGAEVIRTDRFSRRRGHAPDASEITIRDDAPPELRGALFQIAEGDLGLSVQTIRKALCNALKRPPYSGDAYLDVLAECQHLLYHADWFRIYDFVEALYTLLRRGDQDRYEAALAPQWEDLVNDHFRETGVGWKMTGGILESRGTEAFEAGVTRAVEALDQVGLPTASSEIREALADLSRRSDPDLTGAITHAVGALGATAREATGERNDTLGEILKAHPDILIPKPMDDALSKMWGFATQAARHVAEGRVPTRAEAELVVGVCAAACTYLATKMRDLKQT